MNTQTPLLIYGATAAGIGLLLKHHPHALLVERSAQVGHEFVAAFHAGMNWQQEPQSATPQTLRKEMLRRNLLTEDGLVHLPPVAVLLLNLIKQEKLPVRLMTRVVEVQPVADGFEVTVQSADGLQKITAERIVDTTSHCESAPHFAPVPLFRNLNAMLFCNQPSAAVPMLEKGEGEIVLGRFPGEIILKLALNEQDDWISARRKMHDFWKHRSASLAPWTMAAIADRFEMGVEAGPHTVEQSWQWLPSCAYDNLLAAMDAGQMLEIGGELLETVAAY